MAYLWQFVFTQKDKELDVVAACQRTHWNRFSTDFWCKVTTFGKGIVRFRPFTSIKCVIWPNKSVYVHLQLQVDAILLCHLPHRPRRQYLVARPDAKHGEFITILIIDDWLLITDDSQTQVSALAIAGICVGYRRYLRWGSQSRGVTGWHLYI